MNPLFLFRRNTAGQEVVTHIHTAGGQRCEHQHHPSVCCTTVGGGASLAVTEVSRDFREGRVVGFFKWLREFEHHTMGKAKGNFPTQHQTPTSSARSSFSSESRPLPPPVTRHPSSAAPSLPPSMATSVQCLKGCCLHFFISHLQVSTLWILNSPG